MDNYERYNKGGYTTNTKQCEPPQCEKLESLPKPFQRLSELEKLHGSIHEALITLRNKLRPVLLESVKTCGTDSDKCPRPIVSPLNEIIEARLQEAMTILGTIHDITGSLDL